MTDPADPADPADPPPAASSSAAARRLLLLVIVGLLALLFVGAFGGQMGQLDPGLGDPQRIYGAPQPSVETAS
jgi:hypothetical protein